MKPPAPPRYRAEASYARSEDTRRRIIEAAIQIFGERGFGGASTRDIAAAAGVNSPALHYHFEGKEGLYQACAEALVQAARERLRPIHTQIQQALAAEAPRAELVELLLRLQDQRVDMAIGAPEQSASLRFLAQDQFGNGPDALATAIARRGAGEEGHQLARLIARITGQPEDDAITLLRVVAVQGQLMPFYFMPRITLAMLGWKDFQRERLSLVKTALRSHTGALIRGWLEP